MIWNAYFDLPVSLGPPNSFPWFDASYHPRSSCSWASSFHSAGAHGKVSTISPQKNRVSWENLKEPKRKQKLNLTDPNFVQQFSYFDMSFDIQKKALQGFKKSWWIFRHARPHLKLSQIEAKNVAGTTDILKFIDTDLSNSTNQDFKTLGFSHRNLPLDIQKVFAGDLRHPG